jgi:hypothetical protein
MTKARDLADNAEGTKTKAVDAKGDLIVGTAADTAARLAVGNRRTSFDCCKRGSNWFDICS